MRRALTMPGLRTCLLLCWLCLWHQTALAQAANAFIDVSVRVFETATMPTAEQSADSGQAAAHDELTPEAVRDAEQRYLPMQLRYYLEASGRFGAVRVLPLLDNGAELTIEGQILQSDPYRLELALSARDSTGRIWLDRLYTAEAVPSTSIDENARLDDDFAALYRSAVRDLVSVLDTLSAEDLRMIDLVALLRYGQGLAPQHFEGFIGEQDGRFTALRLPANDDPLLVRIQAIREREFLFIDVVDEEYSRFFADVKPVYSMWREYRREQSDSASAREQREAAQPSQFPRGSYYALQENYNNYRWAKLQELYLDELSEGFANETAPTDIELADSLYRLTGTMEQQYREWRSILAELYELEVGETQGRAETRP